MRRVLIIGSGGREHALAQSFSMSPSVEFVAVAPGNVGMMDVAQVVNLAMDDFSGILAYVKTQAIDLVFIGPEAPLSLGIVDFLSKEGICVFGPTQAAAKLESSKAYAKQIMNRYGIPTAAHVCVHSQKEALDYLSHHPAPIVIKADGLMAGKGVVVAMKDAQALEAIQDIYENNAADYVVVIEEYLEGEEFSLLAFVHEDCVIPLDIAKDHKRAYDQDLGPNTGGMGAYSPVPHISSELISEAMTKVMIPMAKAMVLEGVPFTGILYGGLMATKSGIKTIEFNVRFGDPETEVLLPRLLNPLDQVILDVLAKKEIHLSFDPRFCVGVVMAAQGYPKTYLKHQRIEGLDAIEGHVYHMGTIRKNGELVSNGGRVLLIHDFGKTLKEARDNAYQKLGKVSAPTLFYRSDIGKK